MSQSFNYIILSMHNIIQMGRGGRVSGGKTNINGNGGILGSGVFGLFGSTVSCKDSDNSFYCNFVKFFNFLIMILTILFIIYIISVIILPAMYSKKRK
jgi:hypothetical protein